MRILLTAVGEVKSREEIELLLAKARQMRYNDVEEGVMTFAQAMKKEGLQEGEALGKLYDKQDVLIRFLNKRFSLSENEIMAVKAVNSPHRLDAALDAVIDAESKAQVLALLEA